MAIKQASARTALKSRKDAGKKPVARKALTRTTRRSGGKGKAAPETHPMAAHVHPYGMAKHTDADWQRKRFQKQVAVFTDAEQSMLERARQFGEDRRARGTRSAETMDGLHHVRIANMLLDEWSITDRADLVAAGFLHDVVEDTPTTLKEIKDLFGDDVGKLVDGMTMWKGSETHELYYRRVARGPMMLRVVKCADTLDTLRSWHVMDDHGNFSAWWRQAHDLALPMARSVSEDIAKTIEAVLDDPWYVKKAGYDV